MKLAGLKALSHWEISQVVDSLIVIASTMLIDSLDEAINSLGLLIIRIQFEDIDTSKISIKNPRIFVLVHRPNTPSLDV